MLTAKLDYRNILGTRIDACQENLGSKDQSQLEQTISVTKLQLEIG